MKTNKQKGKGTSVNTYPARFMRGFTIIELIVVIAIIAVLASIVLVNVTQYIAKGRDASAQGNLATMLTNGAVYYDSNSGFNATSAANNWINIAGTSFAANSACAGNTGFTGPCQALVGVSGGSTAGTSYVLTVACSKGSAGSATALACNTVTGTDIIANWCGSIPLKGGTNYCVDSTGAKKNSTCTVSGTSTGFCG